MDKSASEIYGPLWERIEDLCTAPDSEREEKLKELFDFGMQTKKECEILDLEYQEIRNKNCELEEKLREQYDNLDKQKAQIPEGDIIYHRILCADRYKEFWNLLDCNSQEFLVTADYIYERIKSCKKQVETSSFRQFISSTFRQLKTSTFISALYPSQERIPGGDFCCGLNKRY